MTRQNFVVNNTYIYSKKRMSLRTDDLQLSANERILFCLQLFVLQQIDFIEQFIALYFMRKIILKLLLNDQKVRKMYFFFNRKIQISK